MKLPTLHSPLSTFFCLLLLLAGCIRSDSDSKQQPIEQPLKGLTLRLAVVDDPALAAAIMRARGEWSAETGSEVEVVETTEKALLKADRLPADAVVCPAYLVGVLAEREWLAPVPKRILSSPEWAGVFELPKLREAAWGKQPMAIPFGSPVFCCYYRADLLEKLGRRPPRTWAEYQELAKLLAKNPPRPPAEEEQISKNSPRPLVEGQGVRAWSGTIEPLAPGWAGLVLLARAAPSIKHRDNYSALFNLDTMEPMIASPPMVQALEELVATAKFGPADPFRYDPAAARAAFWSGRCGMALTWPSKGRERRGAGETGRLGEYSEHSVSLSPPLLVSPSSFSPSPLSPPRVGFVELPGSRRVFNPGGNVWDQRADDEDSHVPLLTIAGRLGVVGKTSAQADAAFQLLLWLSGSRMSPQISAQSPATTLFRQSNLKSPGQWVEKSAPAAAAWQYGDATEAALSHEQWLDGLRLPGRAEYLAALDDAVATAVRGEKSPSEALLEAAAKWQNITTRLGLERQKSAYRHSLGLE